jgi:non-ribosomal peptide synthase protein (TIGR01720 family)
MTKGEIRNRIDKLGPKAKKLLLLKLGMSFHQKSKMNVPSGSKRLVAYVEAGAAFEKNELRAYLKERLPGFMVPAVIVNVENIPTLPNGKIDRRALSKTKADRSQNLSEQTIATPTQLQESLIGIWEEVLGFSPVAINDNFFEIGGDSILSIQIIAKVRKLGISVSPNQLFEHQTIAELAAAIPKSKSKIDVREALVGEVPLLPIQHWFFENHKSAPHFWNQGVIIRELPFLTEKIVDRIANSLVANHDALRTSFTEENGTWKASITKPQETDTVVYNNLSTQDKNANEISIKKTLANVQAELDLSEGSLFKCLYFNNGTERANIMVLVAHHLVVDMVSWQIIVEDFISAVRSETQEGENNFPLRTTSIKTWADYLMNLLNSTNLRQELGFWKEQIADMAPLPKDYDENLPLAEKDMKSISFSLDTSETKLLVGKANKAFGTRTDELLLTAVVDSLGRWTRSMHISVAMERHGRETHQTPMDLSRTVGWFTAFYPMKLKTTVSMSSDSKIMSVKEQLRKVPNGGLGYGVLRYYSRKLGTVNYPQIVFNYLGRQNVAMDKMEFMMQDVRHPLNETYQPLEINAIISNEVLEVRASYGRTIFKAQTMERLMTDFENTLKRIIKHCAAAEATTYTPSDFPESQLNQDDLDNLLGTLD